MWVDSTEPDYIWLAGTAFTRAYAHEAQKEPCLLLGTWWGVQTTIRSSELGQADEKHLGRWSSRGQQFGSAQSLQHMLFRSQGEPLQPNSWLPTTGASGQGKVSRDTGQKYSSSQDNIGQLVRPRVFLGPSCHSIWTKDYQ